MSARLINIQLLANSSPIFYHRRNVYMCKSERSHCGSFLGRLLGCVVKIGLQLEDLVFPLHGKLNDQLLNIGKRL